MPESDIKELLTMIETPSLAIEGEGILANWRDQLVPFRKREWLESGTVEVIIALKDAEAAMKIHKVRLEERAKMKALFADLMEQLSWRNDIRINPKRRSA